MELLLTTLKYQVHRLAPSFLVYTVLEIGPTALCWNSLGSSHSSISFFSQCLQKSNSICKTNARYNVHQHFLKHGQLPCIEQQELEGVPQFPFELLEQGKSWSLVNWKVSAEKPLVTDNLLGIHQKETPCSRCHMTSTNRPYKSLPVTTIGSCHHPVLLIQDCPQRHSFLLVLFLLHFEGSCITGIVVNTSVHFFILNVSYFRACTAVKVRRRRSCILWASATCHFAQTLLLSKMLSQHRVVFF